MPFSLHLTPQSYDNSIDNHYIPLPPPSLVVVHQPYDSDVNKEYVIRGNSAILKCSIPSFVADFVSVTAWVTDKGETFFPSENYGKITQGDC